MRYPETITFNYPRLIGYDGPTPCALCEHTSVPHHHYFDDEPCQSVHLDCVDQRNLDNSSEVVAPSRIAVLIDYPLLRPIKVLIDNTRDISRLVLALAISAEYQRIFMDADKYGIHGYELHELDLVEVSLDWVDVTGRHHYSLSFE